MNAAAAAEPRTAAVYLLTVRVRNSLQRQVAVRGIDIPSARLREIAWTAWKGHYGNREKGVRLAEWSLLGESVAVLRKVAAAIAEAAGVEVIELGAADSAALRGYRVA